MRSLIAITTVLFVIHFVSNDVLARPDRKVAKTTEEPKLAEQPAAMTANMTDSDEDDNSAESGEEETEDTEIGEDDKITIDSKTAFTCASRPTEITDFETQCMAEYKAMKKAKCNMTEEEKMKKMNTMESMESGSHASHVGKRESPMGDDMMNSTEATTNTTKMTTMRHRKRSCHYYQCILKKLDVLDEATMLPNKDMFKTWVTNNITEDGEKSRLQERVTECFNELRESGFYNMDTSKSEEVSGEVTNVRKGKTSCNAALKLLKCLSKQDGECPAFKFP